MHELSIAISIVEGAAEEMERRGGGALEAVHLRLGPLSGVVKEALLFAYDVACEGTPLQGSRLEVEDMAVRVFCPVCRVERAPVSLNLLVCPECGNPAPDVTQGAELEIYALELCS